MDYISSLLLRPAGSSVFRRWMRNASRAFLTKSRLVYNFSSGSFRCNKNNCTTCPYIEDGRTQYTFNSTGQMNQIKSHITCETSNVIYMIQCTKCNLQYIGETKRRLKERFNEHRRPIINTSSYNPTGVSRHFITGNHTVNHMLLIPLPHPPRKHTGACRS